MRSPVALLGAWIAAVALLGCSPSVRDVDPAVDGPAKVAAPAPVADFGAEPAGVAARTLAQWVVASADHGGKSFALIDKGAAMLYMFGSDGRLVGASPVLLGLAIGDDSVPGIGDRPVPLVRPEERTTPAGRFSAAPGVNLDGEQVVWVDYDAAVSMHSVRATVASERRLERLSSPDPAQRRISYGCINVPARFFAEIAAPAFSTPGGLIYVLPETRPLERQFPAMGVATAATATPR